MERLSWDTLGLVVRVLVPVGALAVGGWGAALGTLIFQEGSLWLAPRLTDACYKRVASRLFLAAYALRACIALPIHYLDPRGAGNGALFLDDYTNDLVAEWLVRIARGEGLSIFPGHQYLLDGLYPYLLMLLYAVFGHTPLLPKMLNICATALSAVLVFDIARRAFRPSTAAVAAIGAIILPSLIVWSIVSVKESLIVFLTLIGLWSIQQLIDPPVVSRGAAVVALIAAIGISLNLRSTSALILVGVLIAALVARAHARQRVWNLVLSGTLLIVLLTGGLWIGRSMSSDRPVMAVVEDVVLQVRHRRAQEAANARSQIRPDLDVSVTEGSTLPAAEAASDAAPFSFTGDILDPLGYALLAPAPWQARSSVELLAGAEMLVWYVLLGASFFAWRTRPAQPAFVLCLVLYGVASWVVLAASEGNLGNLVRHRVMLAPTLLILGSAGLVWLWERVPRQGAPTPRRAVAASQGEP
jgi:hypothetical protein